MYSFIKINFSLYVVGIILFFESCFLLFPVTYSFIVGEIISNQLLISYIIILLISLVLIIFFRKHKDLIIQQRDAFFTVTISWLLVSFFGAIPYYLSGIIPDFIDAFFESVSGFTTTGASIITDVEILPKSILLWRSETHWMGGMGIIVLVLAIMPLLKIGGTQLFSAEASIVVQDKIKPKIIDIAKRLWGIYILLTLLEIIFLHLEGMPLFDSICHSFATIATGGFSTKNTSIGVYNPIIQYTVIIFMFLSGINFTLHYYLLKGRFKNILKNEELRLYLLIALISSVTITLFLFYEKNLPLEEAFRKSSFQVVSILTCTGFATDDYNLWPTPAYIIIFMIMLSGACAGSTGGGIKVIRHLILFKYLKKMFLDIIHPRGIHRVRYNNQTLQDELVHKVISFILFYLLVFFLASFILCATGIDLQTSIGSVATTMAGIGPGLNLTGPMYNYHFLSHFDKIILCITMLAGRLELYTFFIIFTPYFWKR